ncbi:Crp/Fnr family transcriptional regulator [Isoptericola haloaureus]|uniref:Crp/Fnr family transcriptional regulator n=1 Tax=Isoptericola haloaureus TaxID=1542902 RepID=A0ABU7ZA80_9MICO
MTADDSVPAWEPASFLGLIDEPERSRLVSSGHRTDVPAGTVLMPQGVVPDTLVVLLDGAAEAVRVDQHGHETRVTSFGPGDAAGLAAVCADVPALADIRTSRSSQVLAVPARTFRHLVTTPAVSEAAISTLAALTYTLEEHRMHGSYGNVRSLVCHWILSLAARSGVPQADGSVVVACTQAELASWAGVSREAVVRHLRAMRLEGLVTTTRGHMTIHDPDAIRAAAEDDRPPPPAGRGGLNAAASP